MIRAGLSRYLINIYINLQYIANILLTFSNEHDNITTLMIESDIQDSTLHQGANMWNNSEIQADYAREQYRDYLATAEHDRLILACGRPLALSRRVARPLGRALFNLGAWLLRYGKDERTAELRRYRASARSIKLN